MPESARGRWPWHEKLRRFALHLPNCSSARSVSSTCTFVRQCSWLLRTQSGPVANDLDNLREALFSLDPEQEQLYAGLEAESASVKQAVTDAERGIQERRAELDALWSEDRECEYELSSVFMHRGEWTICPLSV